MTAREKKDGQENKNIVPKWQYHIEGDVVGDRASFIVSGVIGVSEMSDNVIKILTRSGSVTMTGSKLNIVVYEFKCLHISGKIDNIIFFSKEKRRKI